MANEAEGPEAEKDKNLYCTPRSGHAKFRFFNVPLKVDTLACFLFSFSLSYRELLLRKPREVDMRRQNNFRV